MSINVVIFEHVYYCQHVFPSEDTFLPNFDDISPYIEHFKPGFIY